MSLVGTWDVESSENFDEYLKELGVGFVLRKTASSVKPTVIIENEGNKWNLRVQSTFKNSEINAVEGVEFEETTLDGRTCKTVISRAADNKIVQEQRDPATKELKSTIVREVVDGKFVQTLIAGKVTAVRTYKRTK